MSKQYDDFLNALKQKLNDCEDLIAHECGSEGARYALIYIKGITARDFVSERLLRPLLRCDISSFDGNFGALLEATALRAPQNPNEAAESAVKGDVVIIAESKNGFFATLANAQYTHGRSIQEPTSDVTVRGAKSGFVEDAETNMALIRKYIRTPDLKFLRFTVGSVSQTKVIMAFVSGRAEGRLVEELKQRLSQIEASVITDSANIAMLLSGSHDYIFQSCGSTEKVDKAASKLMSGRIAVIVDGSPFVLTIPLKEITQDLSI